MKDLLNRWLDGDFDAFGQMPDVQEGRDLSLDQIRDLAGRKAARIETMPGTRKIAEKH